MKYILHCICCVTILYTHAQSLEIKVPTTVGALNQKFGTYTTFMPCEFPCDFGNEYIWKLPSVSIIGYALEAGDESTARTTDKIEYIMITATKKYKLLDLEINNSTVTTCKKLYAHNFKKTFIEKNTYKVFKNNQWHYLSFNSKNVLTKIVIANWEYDVTN